MSSPERIKKKSKFNFYSSSLFPERGMIKVLELVKMFELTRNQFLDATNLGTSQQARRAEASHFTQ